MGSGDVSSSFSLVLSYEGGCFRGGVIGWSVRLKVLELNSVALNHHPISFLLCILDLVLCPYLALTIK